MSNSQEHWRLAQHRGRDNVGVEGGRRFYFILNDVVQRYCLYSLSESEIATNPSEGAMKSFPEPILTMDKGTFPEFMSFAKVGSLILMVGGWSTEKCTSTRKLIRCFYKNVYCYDCLSSSFYQAPSLNSGKRYPLLFTCESKLFALSYLIYSQGRKNPFLDPKPRFEVLDTLDMGSGWTSLKEPKLNVTNYTRTYTIKASVCYGLFICISVQDAGTYVYDIIAQFWKYVSSDPLPFEEQAKYVSDCPQPMCYGRSVRTGKFCAYQFNYEPDNSVFSFDEIEIQTVESGPSLPFQHTFQNSCFSLPVGNNMMFSIVGGLDRPTVDDYDPSNVYRYIQVTSLAICNIKNKKKKRKSKKRKQLGTMAAQGSGSNQNDELDEGGVGGNCENEKLMMSCSWGTIYFAGPMADLRGHIAAVFVM